MELLVRVIRILQRDLRAGLESRDFYAGEARRFTENASRALDVSDTAGRVRPFEGEAHGRDLLDRQR